MKIHSPGGSSGAFPPVARKERPRTNCIICKKMLGSNNMARHLKAHRENGDGLNDADYAKLRKRAGSSWCSQCKVCSRWVVHFNIHKELHLEPAENMG